MLTCLRHGAGMRRAVLALAALACTATFAHAAPARARFSGWPLTLREGEALFAGALRAPGDSAALAAALTRAAARLQAGGWLEASLTGEWRAGEPAELALQVTAGERFHWASPQLDVPASDTAFVRRVLRWPLGAPVDPGDLERRLEGAVREAEQDGHAWAQLEITSWQPESARVRVRVTGALGPRVRVSGVRIEGLQVTRLDVATRALGRWQGVPYNPAAARASAARLAQLGVFSRAEFLGLEGGTQWESGVLAFRVAEPRYNRFEGALGVQGEAGVVGLATLGLGNLAGTARSAELGWQSRGRGRTDFSARYVEPFVAGLPFRMEVGLAQELQDSTYTRTRWGARLGHTLATGDRVEAGLEQERVVQTRGEAVTADLQNTVFAFERDGRDDVVTPRRGTRLSLAGTGVFKRERFRAPVSGAPVSRRTRAGVVDVRAELHRRLGASTGWALNLRGAGRFASEARLADYERTPVGGASTLRGHDEGEFRADRVALSRLEYRVFPGSAGEQLAVFWDHAHMVTREPIATDPLRDRLVTRAADGVGVGLRLRAAGGLVDVDYGLAPGRSFLEGRIHLRLVSNF